MSWIFANTWLWESQCSLWDAELLKQSRFYLYAKTGNKLHWKSVPNLRNLSVGEASPEISWSCKWKYFEKGLVIGLHLCGGLLFSLRIVGVLTWISKEPGCFLHGILYWTGFNNEFRWENSLRKRDQVAFVSTIKKVSFALSTLFFLPIGVSERWDKLFVSVT